MSGMAKGQIEMYWWHMHAAGLACPLFLSIVVEEHRPAESKVVFAGEPKKCRLGGLSGARQRPKQACDRTPPDLQLCSRRLRLLVGVHGRRTKESEAAQAQVY
jgi:hypothetical protein